MKDLMSLSGPWTGLSIQHKRRLTERMQLRLGDNRIHGTGSDVDGDFVVDGTYDPATESVHIVRRYTRVTWPVYGATFALYDYRGTWDGQMISGNWRQRDEYTNGGPFEMWPDREQDQQELAIQIEEAVGSHT
ncbi:MAG: hypothetical protein SNJ74_00340 [Fimbriimonadaceae bacterium]